MATDIVELVQKASRQRPVRNPKGQYPRILEFEESLRGLAAAINRDRLIVRLNDAERELFMRNVIHPAIAAAHAAYHLFKNAHTTEKRPNGEHYRDDVVLGYTEEGVRTFVYSEQTDKRTNSDNPRWLVKDKFSILTGYPVSPNVRPRNRTATDRAAIVTWPTDGRSGARQLGDSLHNLPENFTLSGDELGPTRLAVITGKIRRGAIAYHELLPQEDACASRAFDIFEASGFSTDSRGRVPLVHDGIMNKWAIGSSLWTPPEWISGNKPDHDSWGWWYGLPSVPTSLDSLGKLITDHVRPHDEHLKGPPAHFRDQLRARGEQLEVFSSQFG